MKAVKLLILFTVIILTAFFGCTSQENNSDTKNIDTTSVKETSTNAIKDSIITEEPKEIKQTTKKDYTAKYICPMHCAKSGSDKMGNCPECGMELIENPNTQKVIQK